MAESKVVIKINYDKNENDKKVTAPKMVTIWHFPRILAALAILGLLIFLLIYWLSGDKDKNTVNPEQPIPGELTQRQVEKLSLNRSSEPDNQAINITPTKEDLKLGIKNTGVTESKVKSISAIIFDKKVIRASLNTALKDNEPYEQVKGAISLSENQTIQLYYFNQLKDIKDKALYHYWSKNGQTVYKKQLDLKTGRAKVLSSKSLSYKDKGEWQIQLVDKKGKVFSEVKFVINNE